MIDLMEKFKQKFKIEEYKIYESDYWIWSLRPTQVTLGSGILSTKNKREELNELTEIEFKDLHNMISIIENTLKKTFKYDIMNYLMLMMVDKQVHYHVIPRYHKKVEFYNMNWIDEDWPTPPNLSKGTNDEETLENILNELKANIVIQ